MTASHGPSRVPGVRRPLHGQGRAAWTTGDKPDPDNPLTTGLPRGDEWAEHVYTPQDGPRSAADGSDGGRGGSGAPDAPQSDLAATYHALSEAYRDMTRQRDEAEAAYQEATKRIRDLEDELARVRFTTARIRRRKS